jgi:hypothetical protein
LLLNRDVKRAVGLAKFIIFKFNVNFLHSLVTVPPVKSYVFCILLTLDCQWKV